MRSIMEACLKANKNLIQGLRPGTRVRRGPEWPIDTIATLHVDFNTGGFKALLYREHQNISFDLTDLQRREVEGWVIIPKEIQLADVLAAIGETRDPEVTVRSGDGGFNLCTYEGDGEWSVVRRDVEWDLSKPLSGQSDRTLEFIKNLISK